MPLDDSWTPGELTTVLNEFRAALTKWGADRPFVDYEGKVSTLGAIDRASTQLAHGLLAAGVKVGECVTSVLDNSIEQLALMLAVMKIGAVHVPVNTAYKGEFLRHQVHDSGAAVLIVESDFAERVMAIEDGIPEVRVLLVKGNVPKLVPQRIQIRSLASAFIDSATPLTHEPQPADLAILIYTAGTTGPSKGCMISHNYSCSIARQIAMSFEMTADDTVWTPLPGFHYNQISCLVGGFMFGYRVAVYQRFSVSNFWLEMERTQATVAHLLGSMAAMIADAPENEAMKRCYGQLRVIGGIPFPPVAQEKWKKRFGVRAIFNAIFGLTECSLITSATVSEPRPIGCAGRRNDYYDVRLVDDNDLEVPVGQSGEIIVRPKKPHVMFEGYWRRPADTQKLMRNCWFHTGDIGRFDEDGFMYFVDRKKDYLRRRGENISSLEMEFAFRHHPAIADLAVHAVPSEFSEDEVKLTAVLKPGAVVTEEEMCRWSVENLPYFAVPRFIEFRHDLPRNPVGRVLKYQLRDDGVTATTWDREKSDVVLKKR